MIFTLRDLIAVFKHIGLSKQTILTSLKVNEFYNKKFPDYDDFYINEKLNTQKVETFYD